MRMQGMFLLGLAKNGKQLENRGRVVIMMSLDRVHKNADLGRLDDLAKRGLASFFTKPYILILVDPFLLPHCNPLSMSIFFFVPLS